MKPANAKIRPAKRPIRVLMLLENAAYSEDGRVRCEANSLIAAGYEVTVISPAATGERLFERFEGVAGYQFPPPPMANGLIGYFIEYAYALSIMFGLTLWIALRRGFDVIHAHNPPDFLVLIGGFWRLFGKKFVYDQHDLSPDMYKTRFTNPPNRVLLAILGFFERCSCRCANHVITVNDSYKQQQILRSGIPADRITVVRNGPESWHLNTFEPDVSLRNGASVVFGYVGMMGRQDGIDYLLRALSILRDEYGRDDWRCLLIGKGPAMDELQRLAVDLGIDTKVHFTGWVDYEQVPRYIAATDICVVPDPSSEYNDHSTIVKVMEYMAQAKPVVAFDLPEHRVTAADTALYARANDERDFARQLLRLVDDPALRQQLGAAGRQRVEESLTWKHQEAHLLAAYRGLGNRGAVHGTEVPEHIELAAVHS
ncbi:MAG TPA: glycosyltransferase family 4 protein [Lacipirellulaceae bacterium]|jgi:glycosyltransferase involved in cell wall biosynthesis|nr:glycosyltransferase family 4 protein [Lacipirellulaceae bacterium]